LIISSDYYKN